MESLLPVLVALALLAALAFFVLRPLLSAGDTDTPALPVPLPEEELANLLFQRDALLAALRDLQLDLEMGKIGPEDFECLNARYRAEAVRVLRRLDELQEGTPEPVPADTETFLDEWIETAVRHARGSVTTSS